MPPSYFKSKWLLLRRPTPAILCSMILVSIIMLIYALVQALFLNEMKPLPQKAKEEEPPSFDSYIVLALILPLATVLYAAFDCFMYVIGRLNPFWSLAVSAMHIVAWIWELSWWDSSMYITRVQMVFAGFILVGYVAYMGVAVGRLHRRRMWRRLGRGFRGVSAEAEAEITRGIEFGIVDLS